VKNRSINNKKLTITGWYYEAQKEKIKTQENPAKGPAAATFR
jgi:hypothetical protein